MPIKYRLIIALVTATMWLLELTMRWKFIGSATRPQTTQCIVSSWHGRLLMFPFFFKPWAGPVIISDHKDGELIAGVYANFGIHATRGSSSKGGARALLKAIRAAKDGLSPGITPDGPRGPFQEAKAGAAQLALKANLPILPVCYASNRHWRLSSWDKFYVPKPFAKGVVAVGDLVYPKPDDTIEAFAKRIQIAMDANQIMADTYFNHEAEA